MSRHHHYRWRDLGCCVCASGTLKLVAKWWLMVMGQRVGASEQQRWAVIWLMRERHAIKVAEKRTGREAHE